MVHVQHLYEPDNHFRRLLTRFVALRSRAQAYVTPNPEDDLLVRLAVVGFSFEARTEAWNYNHFLAVAAYRQHELTPDVLATHGVHADTWAEFACLAYGFLLGASAADRISELDFSHASALLVSFMWLHINELDALTPTRPATTT